MDNNPFHPKSSPLRPYNLILGRRWSDLEFEEQALARRGMREGFIYIESTPRGRCIAEVQGARCGS